ncbi:hypothetical protein, partial [Paraburkholderia lycopersici]|uniref:hypothetical protein n=1 Tax=Paraburkholderia lycopersici TaxID=416944 RepID=UPI001C40AAFA
GLPNCHGNLPFDLLSPHRGVSGLGEIECARPTFGYSSLDTTLLVKGRVASQERVVRWYFARNGYLVESVLAIANGLEILSLSIE